ncbi:hypothetical protein CVT26_004482 [Gymnopilus dilepis]|uniref:Uncharacterized protein n=1 Tax=Gymnopilus dilepis TaxID=231916 RepID=A0A409WDU3_9AGAR|nr:hypothetical protein CVT26_004482 [Gymnopilus dilepis]
MLWAMNKMKGRQINDSDRLIFFEDTIFTDRYEMPVKFVGHLTLPFRELRVDEATHKKFTREAFFLEDLLVCLKAAFGIKCKEVFLVVTSDRCRSHWTELPSPQARLLRNWFFARV